MCEADLPKLQLISTIGFEGKIPRGLQIHPNKSTVVSALGNNIVLRNVTDDTQTFLYGHTGAVSCLAVGHTGQWLASGQATQRENKTKIIVWDFPSRSICTSYQPHWGRVDSISFSCGDSYIVSLGGRDDLNICVFDVCKKEALMGCKASPGSASYTLVVTCASGVPNCFISGGREVLRLWKINLCVRKAEPLLVPLKKNVRNIRCIEVDKLDDYCYCGTETGDILKVRLRLKVADGFMVAADPVLMFVIQRLLPRPLKNSEKPLYQKGVTALAMLPNGEMLVGAGDGTLALCTESLQTVFNHKTLPRKKGADFLTSHFLYYQEVKVAKVSGDVTSIAVRGAAGHQVYVGTKSCEIFRVNYLDFKPLLLFTSHSSPVQQVAFPRDCSEVFATCSKDTIRVWSLTKASELLRIPVPNWVCSCIDFSQDGKSILSGWSDGKIRAFTPLSGTTMFIIHNAHPLGVTALKMTADCQRVISGGKEGDVRIWSLLPNGTQNLDFVLKEHKGPITDLRIHSNDRACFTTSNDGTCIIWDLDTYTRNQVVFTSNPLLCGCWGLEGLQLVVAGAARQLFYVEAYNGVVIRELEASRCAPVTSLASTPDSCFLVSGSEDKLLKLWRYEEGTVVYVGVEHSGAISSVAVSPDCRHIVSVSLDGAILVWQFPPFPQGGQT